MTGHVSVLAVVVVVIVIIGARKVVDDVVAVGAVDAVIKVVTPLRSQTWPTVIPKTAHRVPKKCPRPFPPIAHRYPKMTHRDPKNGPPWNFYIRKL